MKVHVVSHTHWDREWYHAAERFRQRLVALIDELLDDPGAPRGFLLDGQAVVLEDYLDVRPERASELAAALRDGRVEAGPWFVLADGLIPGGEGLVRNLLAGRRVLQRVRSSSPPVLYCPDSFGHPAALPDIARGFGMPLVVLWRGLGGSRVPDTDTMWWRAADGGRVLLYHLTRSGYGLGANLPGGTDDARARWKEIRREFGDRNQTGAALLLNGADHHAPQRGFATAVRALAGAADGDDIVASSMSAFAGAVVEHASDRTLPTVTGELRDSYGYTWTLQGTLATRAAQKRRYAQRERELVRDVEPWAALAMLGTSRSTRHLLNAAWHPLLLCQPHDTLCGCSVDQVARAMDARLESAATQASGLREQAIHALIGHDADSARQVPARSILIVRNCAPRARSGVATVRLTVKVADVPVGPGSAHALVSRRARAELPRVAWPVGEPVQLLDMTLAHDRTEAPRSYPDNDAVVHFDAAVWIDDAPAYGLLSLPFGGDARPRLPEHLVTFKSRSLSNGRLTVRWDAAGRLTLEDHGHERVIRSLISWESRRDVGDLYTPAVRQRKLVPRFMGMRVVHRGPLRGTIEQRWKLAGRLEHLDVRLRLSLDAGADALRIGVFGENHAHDHRLRLHVRTDVREGDAVADAAFGPVTRGRLEIRAAEARMEHPVPTAPLHRYVSRFDSRRGATVFSDGLAEYELLKDGFAVTILRAVGELSRSDLPERPGHAGWPAPTPEAQSQGPFAAGLALLLHGPRTPTVVAEIEHMADDVLLPLTGDTLRSALRVPPPVHGIALDGHGLGFSAAKESEDGEWLVLRCVNLLDREVAGTWRLGGMIREAVLARLDEHPLTPLEVTGGRVRFLAPARAVLTVLVR